MLDISSLVPLICNNSIEELTELWDKFPDDKLTANFTFQSNSRVLPTSSLSLMHIAAFYDSLESFKFLEQKGIPINILSGDSYYPIHYACLNGSFRVVEYILSVDPSQATVLPQVSCHLIVLTVFSGKSDILQLLFKNGADPNAPENMKNRPLLQAARHGSIECLKVLFENGCKDVNYFDYSLLMMIIASDELDYVPTVVESGVDLEHMSKETYETALSLACLQSYRKTVKYLCDRMKNVDIDPSIRKRAAVHWICQSKDPEIAKFILAKGIDVNRLDEDGNPGPYYLMDLTDADTTIQILELLCENGFDINIQGKSVDGKEANTVLGDFVASIHRPKKVIEWLLEHGADMNANMVASKKSIIETVSNSRNRSLLPIFKKYIPK